MPITIYCKTSGRMFELDKDDNETFRKIIEIEFTASEKLMKQGKTAEWVKREVSEKQRLKRILS